MELKKNIITIVLIIFALLFMYNCYSSAGMVASLDNACDDIQTGILSETPGMFDTTEQFVSCISQRDDAKTYTTMYMVFSIIFIFLVLLSWKIDKLKKKK